MLIQHLAYRGGSHRRNVASSHGLVISLTVGWEGNCYLLKLFLPAFAAAIAGEGGRHQTSPCARASAAS